MVDFALRMWQRALHAGAAPLVARNLSAFVYPVALGVWSRIDPASAVSGATSKIVALMRLISDEVRGAQVVTVTADDAAAGAAGAAEFEAQLSRVLDSCRRLFCTPVSKSPSPWQPRPCAESSLCLRADEVVLLIVRALLKTQLVQILVRSTLRSVMYVVHVMACSDNI